MKQNIYTTLILVFASILSFKAQDMLVKSDGTIVKAKIIEIGEDVIKYKKADNPDGPVYSISTENLTSINYENGTVEKFGGSKKVAKKNEDNEDEDSEAEEKTKKNPILEDEQMKKTIEGIAKDVGEQLLRSCANGKIDNSSTSVYWDATFKDAITGDINIPIITTWKPKWTDGSGKWIKGKIIVNKAGEKKWVYQNDNGLMFSGCGKEFKIKQ